MFLSVVGSPSVPALWGACTRARANPVAARLQSTSRDSSRATRLPALLRSRLHPETTRHRARKPRDHASPSERRITGVRPTGGQRSSLRGAISASVQGAISARVPPSPARARAHLRFISVPPPGCILCCPHSPQREHCFIMALALHLQRLRDTFIFTAHTTHHTHAAACHTRSPLQLQRPCPY